MQAFEKLVKIAVNFIHAFDNRFGWSIKRSAYTFTRPKVSAKTLVFHHRRSVLTNTHDQFYFLFCCLKTFSVFLLLAAPLYAQTVNEWLTTADQTNSLTQQANLSFGPNTGTNNYTITIDDTQTYQTIDGFGAAMCDSSAYVMYNELTASQRGAAMTAMFSPTSGIGLSLCRFPMGASDMAVSNYTYDDMPAGQTDPTLAHFSIAHDNAYIIPCMQQMMAINPNMKIMATPWSPPAWMKDSGTLNGGNFLTQYYANYAQYFVKFIQAYQALGIPIWAISCQNEPLYNPTGYPGMSFPAVNEEEFIRDYMGPALEAAGLTTKILVYDHNWDQYVYPETVLGDAVADFYSFGTAWHWYGGVVTNQQYLQTGFPNKPQYITEAASGTWTGTYGQSIVNDLEELIIGGSENWSKGAIKWPFALDQNMGPQNGGCNTCWGLITVNSATQTFSQGVGFYTLGQASQFIQRGAYYLTSNTFGAGNIEDAAFKNPDGSDVLVVLNSSGSTQSFKAVLNGQAFTASLPSSAVATFKWTGGAIIPQPTASPTPQAQSTWRVRAGGTNYTDSQGNLWVADEDYFSGTGDTEANAVGGTVLPGAADTSLYQTERYGPSFLYSFQAPNQLYQVTLKFNEYYWIAAGQRVFNVMINGKTVLTNFDIVAAAGGANKAIDEVINNIQPDSQGRIVIDFGQVSADNAKVDAIQIIPQPGAATFTPTQPPTKTPTLTPTVTPITLSTWRVNAGGPQFTDTLGNVWSADENYTGGTAATTTNTVTGAAASTDAALYQTQRYGNASAFSYTFNVPAGSYQVSLLFAETYFTTAGDREFNVSINGITVLTNFDIYATAGGQNIAVDEVFNNIAPSGGTITINFGVGSVNNPEVQAIQIIPMSPTATFTPTVTRIFSPTGTSTATISSTFTNTATSTFTSAFTSTVTQTKSNTLTATLTLTPVNTASFTPTATNSFTHTAVNTATPSFTASATATLTFTGTPSYTPTATSSSTATSSLTPTNTLSGTSTPVYTSTATASSMASFTETLTDSMTPTSSYTASFTPTSTPTNMLTFTSTATNTSTNTPAIPTSTKTYTFTPSSTVTNTFTTTGTDTPTATNSFTATATAWVTPTYTFTATRTPSFTATATNSGTNTPTLTATRTVTVTPTLTDTPVPPTNTPTAVGCSGIPSWNGNFVAYSVGQKVSYNGQIYQCIQAHTSESTWEPPVVPALWKDLGPCGSTPTASLTAQNPVVYPNPVTSSTASIQLPVTNATNVKVQMFTVSMREVRTTVVPQVIGNALTVQLMDKSGVSLANGLYYFIIQVNGQKWMNKVLVLR